MKLHLERFAKVLALAGSDKDGEALSALRQAKRMLAGVGMSFTDLSLLIGAGDAPSEDVMSLRWQLIVAEAEIARCKRQVEEYEKELAARPASLRRPLAEIEATMRGYLTTPSLARLSDREISRRTGLSPQTVGNWRARLAQEAA